MNTFYGVCFTGIVKEFLMFSMNTLGNNKIMEEF